MKRAVLALLAAIPAGAVPYFVTVKAWPEIVVPAYFMTKGGILYKTIFFPHTPLLISTVAGLGHLFGFSALLFRSIVSAGLLATAALIASGLERRRGFSLAVTVGVLLSVLWASYMEGLAVWPDALLAPVVLGAALLLERFDASGSAASLRWGGLLLGFAILVKQTSAWVAAAALLWMILRRRRLPAIATLGVAICAPYVVFVLFWGVAYRTGSHLYWTLAMPLFSSHAGEIRETGGWNDVHEAIAPFLILPALPLLRGRLEILRSPMFLMALGTAGMAWPRGGLLHLSSSVGLLAFLGARGVLESASRLASWRSESPAFGRLAGAAVGAAMLLTSVAVAAWSGGGFLLEGRGGNVFYWDDPFTIQLEKEVSSRVPPGGRLLLFNTRRDNLYALTSTRTPNGIYVNSSFWYYFNKDAVSARVMDGLEKFSGWILFREPDSSDNELRKTALYRFLSSRTVVEEPASDSMTWRRVQAPVREK